MALVVLLRAVNVGIHNRFRPSLLARELEAFDVVNIGAVGTFVVRKPVTHDRFRRELLNKLGFATEVIMCDGRALTSFAAGNPFAGQPSGREVVRFVSILSRPLARLPPMAMTIPEDGEWTVKILGCQGQFLYGLYRRQMKAIAGVGRLEKRLGVPMTTRSWNTIAAAVDILSAPQRRTALSGR